MQRTRLVLERAGRLPAAGEQRPEPPSFSIGLPAPNGSSYTAPPVRRNGRLVLSFCHSVGARSYSSTVRFDLRVRERQRGVGREPAGEAAIHVDLEALGP